MVQEQCKKKQRQGDWRKPIHSENCLAASGSMACQSEEGTDERFTRGRKHERCLERKPDARDGPVRFDERGVETECRAGSSGAGNRKDRKPLWPSLHTTAPLLDSTNFSLGSTGDPPDGTGVTVRANETGLFTRQASAIPVGGSPTGAGESPALPIFKARSKSSSKKLAWAIGMS